MNHLFDALCARGKLIHWVDPDTIAICQATTCNDAIPLTFEEVMVDAEAQDALVKWYQQFGYSLYSDRVQDRLYSCVYGGIHWPGVTWPTFAKLLQLPERYHSFIADSYDNTKWLDPKKPCRHQPACICICPNS